MNADGGDDGQGVDGENGSAAGGLGGGAIQGIRDNHGVGAPVRQGNRIEGEAGGVGTDVGGAPLPLVAKDAAIGSAGAHAERCAAAFQHGGARGGLHIDAGGSGRRQDVQHRRIAGDVSH